MAVVIDIIREFSPWIYGACAVAALWYLRVVLVARRDRRYAVFSLEKEQASNRVYSAWGAALGIMIVMGGVYALSTVVFKAVEPQLIADRPTPTPVFVAIGGTPTATPTLPEPDVTATATPTKKPTKPTPRPTATRNPDQPTAAPTEPPIQRPRCPTARTVITQPGVGQSFTGAVAVFGTATVDNFAFYKLEYRVAGSSSDWSYFAGGEAPVSNGRLGTLNPLPPGTYEIKLTVVDKSAQFPDQPCQTTITFR